MQLESYFTIEELIVGLSVIWLSPIGGVFSIFWNTVYLLVPQLFPSIQSWPTSFLNRTLHEVPSRHDMEGPHRPIPQGDPLHQSAKWHTFFNVGAAATNSVLSFLSKSIKFSSLKSAKSSLPQFFHTNLFLYGDYESILRWIPFMKVLSTQ